MNPDADTDNLGGINHFEAAAAVQDPDDIFSMMSSASSRDLVAIIDLDHAPIRELERERLERFFVLQVADLVNHLENGSCRSPKYSGLNRSEISQ
jgi:hypothetical protein